MVTIILSKFDNYYCHMFERILSKFSVILLVTSNSVNYLVENRLRKKSCDDDVYSYIRWPTDSLMVDLYKNIYY